MRTGSICRLGRQASSISGVINLSLLSASLPLQTRATVLAPHTLRNCLGLKINEKGDFSLTTNYWLKGFSETHPRESLDGDIDEERL